MKNFICSFKTQLFVAVMLFCMALSYAQTVSVPAGCTVVVAGTGGNTSTGIVGDGGMVSMPDPSGGGTFTFNPPSGATTITWKLKGDLSNSTVSPFYNAPTQPANGLTANIITYNEFFRSTSTELTNPSFARSKGQVKVGYDQTGCGKSISFDVFKTFTASLPAIVGPPCLKPNTQYTYSVDQIVSDNANEAIGFDSYYWSGLPANIYPSTTFYTSADASSITFKTGATVTPFTLTCCYGRVNPNTADGGIPTINAGTPSHLTCVSMGILVAPAAPVFIATTLSTLATLNSNSSACLAIGQPTFTITYPNSPPGQSYAWSAPNSGWTFSNNTTGTTTTTVTTNGNNNPALLTLTITGACDPAIYNYQINRSVAAPIAIVPTTPSTTCIGSTSVNNVYTINANAIGVSLIWTTIPAMVAGITLSPSANTNSVTITATGAVPGSFTLQAQGTSPCNTTAITTTINVQPLTPVFTASTPSCVVRSATAITTVGVTPVSGATYDWTPLPAGVTCTANCATENPSFIFNSAVGVNSVTLTVKITGTGGCNSATASKIINYIAVATNFPGGGFNDQYVVNGSCGAVTSWVIGTTVPVTSTTYNVSSGNITLTNSGGGTNNVLTVSGAGGAQITSVCANMASGIQVCATSFGLLTQKPSGPASNTTTKEEIKNVIITPNPNSGNFSIKVAAYNESASATLADFSGNEIQTYQLRKGENKIEKEGLKKGTYFVILKIDGKQETRQVIVK